MNWKLRAVPKETKEVEALRKAAAKGDPIAVRRLPRAVERSAGGVIEIEGRKLQLGVGQERTLEATSRPTPEQLAEWRQAGVAVAVVADYRVRLVSGPGILHLKGKAFTRDGEGHVLELGDGEAAGLRGQGFEVTEVTSTPPPGKKTTKDKGGSK